MTLIPSLNNDPRLLSTPEIIYTVLSSSYIDDYLVPTRLLLDPHLSTPLYLLYLNPLFIREEREEGGDPATELVSHFLESKRQMTPVRGPVCRSVSSRLLPRPSGSSVIGDSVDGTRSVTRP